MKIAVTKKMLDITIHEEMDFDKSLKVNLEIKAHLKMSEISAVIVNLDRIQTLKTCSIGSLLYVSEIFSGKCQVNLRQCGPEVEILFNSSALDNHFKKLENKAMALSCMICFESRRQSPGQCRMAKNLQNFAAKARLIRNSLKTCPRYAKSF